MSGARLAVSSVALLIAGCGQMDAPILDGPPAPSYAADLAACTDLAREKGPGGYETAMAAAAGGVLGGALADHDGGTDVAVGATVGALAGLAGGASEASGGRRGILLKCLEGRGHAVVG